ncbi:MAG TPA: sugar phosphate isomerase/epimerase family protein [Alphaproteobacteria bacterium]|nr:sugar phosphate isomerase/epimerase family protein [Alphaproteobacteria bacterium]
MLRAMSSYVCIGKRLHPGLLDSFKRGGAQAVEVFAARGHFNYHEKEHVRELGNWFASQDVEFHSVHSPIYMSNDFRSGGPPLSIVAREKRERIEAMDEIKRAIEAAEIAPFRFLVQHIGTSDEAFDPRKFEDALSSIEHLRAFARPLGVTLLVENTPNELATPERLQELIRTLHYPDLGVCFDTGHAHLEGSVDQAFALLEDRIRSTHVHDNKKDRDSHLWPGEGGIDWGKAMKSLRSARHVPALLMEIEGTEGVDISAKMAESFKRLEGQVDHGQN